MKKIILFLAFIFMMTLVVGCMAPKAETTPDPTAEPTQEATNEPDHTDEPVEATDAPVEDVTISIATLAGPTGMGMIKMIDDAYENYDISIYTAPDQLTAKIINGEIQIATVPSNLAAVLYAKTNGAISISSVNTLGVLYIVENGDTVNSIEDLAGKTLYATGQGASPEYILNKVLAEKGLTDVNVEFMGVHADLANAVAAGDITLAILPEPFVSVVLAKNADVKVKINIDDEWQSIFGEDVKLPMGVTVVNNEFYAANKDAVDKALDIYGESVEYVLANPDAATALMVKHELIGSEAIAKSALPRSGITYTTGEDMISMLDSYFKVLFSSNPASVGGVLPDESIYLK